MFQRGCKPHPTDCSHNGFLFMQALSLFCKFKCFFLAPQLIMPQRGEIRLCGLLRPFQCPDLSKNTGQSQLSKNQQVRGITLTILL